jgi:hypothetical protein
MLFLAILATLGLAFPFIRNFVLVIKDKETEPSRRAVVVAAFVLMFALFTSAIASVWILFSAVK